MANEQVTKISGRLVQNQEIPNYFLINLTDINAADVMYIDSAFGTTSLRDFLIFQNPDMESTEYDLYVDTTYIVGATKPEDPGDTPDTPETPSGITSAKLGIAILGSMVLGTE